MGRSTEDGTSKKERQRRRREEAAAALGISVEELIEQRRSEAAANFAAAAQRRGLTVDEYSRSLKQKATKKETAPKPSAKVAGGSKARERTPVVLLGSDLTWRDPAPRRRMDDVRRKLSKGNSQGK